MRFEWIGYLVMLAGLAACGGGDVAAPVAAKAGLTMGLAVQGASATADDGLTIAGYRAGYTIVRGDDGQVALTEIATGQVSTYNGIKLIKFFDKWTSLDIDGADGQVYRLYQAAFNRKPDLAGLGFWVQTLRGGSKLIDIAGSFLASDEFKQLYGDNVPASAFIDSLYQNILHRPGELEGYRWWVDAVDNGAERRQVLLGFADSDENKRNLLADIQNGFDFAPLPQQDGTPRVPKFSSYENKVAAAKALGPQWLPPEVASANAAAFADFFQDGTYSLVTHTLEYFTNNTMDPTKLGRIKFYQRGETGDWIDRTPALLADTTGCLHPRKAIVADFNGDGKPDVFFACHGYDSDPYPGERQRILFSQKDGTYRNVLLPTSCFCHAATAIDTAGTGYADIIVTDNITRHTPFFLVNQRDGSFKEDLSRLPAQWKNKAIFSIEAADFFGTGHYDLWVGGNEPGATAGSTTTEFDIVPTILRNDGTASYADAPKLELPSVPDYGLPLDAVVNNGKLYLLRTNIGGGPNNYGVSFYTTAAVQVIDLKTATTSVPYTHKGPYGNGMQWVNWLVPVGDQVMSMDAVYGITLQ